MPAQPQILGDGSLLYPDGTVLLPNGNIVAPGAMGMTGGGGPTGTRTEAANGPGATYVPTGYNFGDYMVDAMPPDQRDAYIGKMEAEQTANGGALQAPSNAYRTAGGDGGIWNEGGAYNETGKAIRQGQSDVDKIIAELQRQADITSASNNASADRMDKLIDAQDPRNAAFVANTDALADQLGGYRDTANQGSIQALNTYTSGLNDLNAYNMRAAGNLENLYNQIGGPLQSQVSWQGDLSSQAAVADPAALAAQNQALSFLSGVSGGSLDWQSEAAKAYADPRYLAMRDQGLADMYDVSQGSKDVHVGQEDPAAYQAALEALGQYKELTNPAVTDKEKFLWEQARQNWELDERGLAAARMSDLRRRGMAGSGAELTQDALTRQSLGNKRTLADLAAAAGGIDRSMSALAGYSQLGQALNAQGNALAVGNSDRQSAALAQYLAGADSAQNASFDQAYKRGLGADQASAANQSTRLQGGIAHGNQANAMQDDAFNRGAAADQTAQFNRAMSIDVSKFNSNYAASERDAQWNRGQGLAATQLNASAQNSNNLSNAFQGTTSVLNNNYTRDRDYIAGKDLALTRGWTADQTALGQRLGVEGTRIGNNNTTFGNNVGIGQMGVNNTQWSTGALAQNYSDIAGMFAAGKAAANATQRGDAALEASKSVGLMGTPILSQEGILGLKGIPLL